MNSQQLQQILEAHQLWLRSNGKEGKRAELSGAAFNDPTLSPVLECANFERAGLNGVAFGNSDLTDANFGRAELRRADFGEATLRRTNFREADLQNANLEGAKSLLSTQLAGADVAGAKLPQAIAQFEGLKTIAEATSNAQKLFIAMLGGCLYSWLTIGTTKDAALLTNSASSPLPVIGTALPIVGFYLVAPVVLVALYFYFLLNMQRLWEALADLPAVFPDGRPLDKMADPWLFNGLVRAYFFRLRNERPPLSRLQEWLSIVLAWWVVPVTLVVFWARFLMRHDWFGTAVHIVLLTAAIGFGWMSYRLARATLRGEPRKSFVWAQAWKDVRTYKRIAGVSASCVLGVILYLISVDAIEGVPSRIYTPVGPMEYRKRAGRGLGAYNLRRLVPRDLENIAFSPFANLVGQDLSTKPPNWTGDVKEYALVKGAYLRQANMQYAHATGAFLVNADMIRANLSNAELTFANLSKAQLSGANLTNANLNVANLQDANLSNAKLTFANLFYAKLPGAILQGADLSGADLSGADLSGVRGLSKSQLDKAKTDEKTVPPANLRP